ncbi:diaminopimelate epimerase [Alicyclobacillus sp. SP_1]|uniref:diaminopimelate epimerase n=1 Tax=Alicyclobacillus sp. SP_1 TaxID=2942475 RepID=UPI0021581390|nr:diaminopimelate epimerase [Alicyclobacillus sp. SP_1]
MKVTKMHGLGNNYIYVSEWDEVLQNVDFRKLAKAVSDVRKGIGSDGLIVVSKSSLADVRMRIFNADGSEAENCGNGLRCVAKYAFERGYVGDKQAFSIETKAGVYAVHVEVDSLGKVPRVTVDMGAVSFEPKDVGYVGRMSSAGLAEISLGDETYSGHVVSVGNPHFVVFVKDAVNFPVAEIGPSLENHPHFLNRTNVEFVTAQSANELDFRVWERGSGITYACGTGACASVAAGIRAGVLKENVVVHLLGGDLQISVQDGRIWMTGDAVEVLTGEYLW